MKVSKKRRIEIIKHIIENEAEDCIGSDADCCNCQLKRNCMDADRAGLLRDAKILLEAID